MDILWTRYNQYVVISEEFLDVFNRLDKKYNLRNELHNSVILDNILEDSELKQEHKVQVIRFVDYMKSLKTKRRVTGENWYIKYIVPSSNIYLN